MLAVGIDIGGTSIKGAVVNEKGVPSEMFSLPVNPEDDQETTINKLAETLKEYLSTHKFDEPISGIGIGIPGSIDAKNGVCIYSNNLNWKDLEIIKIMKKHFDLPIRITNDANAAALGEATFGAGKKYPNVIMITLGTGVGGGVIIDNKIYEGSDGTGTELGHMIIVKDGVMCTCGRRGCLEQYASANALARETKEAMDKNPDSLMHEISKELGKINAKVPFIAARRYDKAAIEVVDEYVEYLGTGICNFCNIFRPDCCVLSGGVSKEGDYLIDKLTKFCKDNNYGFPYSKQCIIKVAELGYMAGIIGAATLVLNN